MTGTGRESGLDRDEAVAIVGIAAKVPGARDVEEFWLNLVRGRESVTALTDDELAAHGVSAELLADPAYVRSVSMMPDAELFDAAFFGMTPREARTCDPQIRVFLEIAHSAIENAGYDPDTLSDGVGVFASAGPAHYAEQHLLPHSDISGSALSGVVTLNHGDYVATMASYKLNLRGPSVTVLTACSSTLVALHLACQSLRVGDCDTAIVGGADVEFPYGQGYLWAPGGVRSRDGHCRPFDATATGTVFGAGACAVVLKRLGDALADGDQVRAVVRASALNNDGADKVSFGAPSKAGQTSVIMEAMAVSGLGPQDISYVEAHGTGTALGDPIEVAALADAYARLAGGRELPRGRCGLGSVKGNVGHLGPVAGITGLIKTALALEREQLPPSIGFTSPNPRLGIEDTPFRVQDRLTAWPRDPQRPRRAAVSSMGIGGSNVHVVLEEPPPVRLTAHTEEPRVVVWSGRTVAAEETARAALARHFSSHGEDQFADAVATLQHGRTAHPVRGAAVCVSSHDTAAALRDGSRVLTGAAGSPPRVGLLLPGQGTQYVRMAHGLYASVPAFATALDGWFALLDDPSLRRCWLGSDEGLNITDTRHAQPLLFAVEAALAQVLTDAGLPVAALLGHSVGELAAAAVAGVFAPADAARLVLARATAMHDHAAGGGMLAVAATEDAVAEVLADGVVVAVVNAPDQVVLAGTDDGLIATAAALDGRGLRHQRLRTSGAFHTPLLADAAAAFECAFDGVALAAPRIPVVSAASGGLLTAEQATDPAFWARQLVEPVRFGAALDALVTDLAGTDGAGGGVLVEAGPGRVLGALARRHPVVRTQPSMPVLATLPDTGDDDALATLLGAAAQLWSLGHPVDWGHLGQQPLRQRVPVPGYGYQRERFWVDPPAPVPAPAVPEPVMASEPVAEAAVPAVPVEVAAPVSPYAVIGWTQTAGDPAPAPRRGTALVLLPADADRGLDVVLALQQAGMRTVRARPAAAYCAGREEFGVRPGVADDIGRVLDELGTRGVAVDLLVHATATDAWSPLTTDTAAEQLDASFFALLALVQRGLRTDPAGKLPGLLVLASGSADVSGADPVDPVKATLHGAIRTFAAELPWLGCRLVDVSPNTAVADLRDEILRSGDVVVALRGRRRWVPCETAWEPGPIGESVVRPHGAYVITGGLGGLGLELLRGLAGTGVCPRVALLGRHVPADDGDAVTGAVAEAITDAEAVGAQVRAIRCDVGEPRDVRRALDLVAATMGPVAGVFHLAGVAGDGMLQVRPAQRAAEVLRPKVLGTAVLVEALTGRPPLDFLVAFSSRAAVDGLVGSGDYAAGNAVLDLAARDGEPVGRVLSIGFPSWAEVGMAARPPASPDPEPGEPHWETVLDEVGTWALDEHRVAGRPILPGTAHLDLMLRAAAETGVADLASGAVVVTDVAFSAPLDASTARRVRVEFAPDGDRYRWTVRSRPDAGGPWLRHVTGLVDGQGTEELTAGKVDLDALRAATDDQPLPEVDGGDRMFVLGPRWRCFRALRAGGDERVAELALPVAFAGDLAHHFLHPALLDCVTGVARDDTEPFHVPFLYRRMVVYAPLPAQITGHVQRTRVANGLIVADVDVLDADGHVLVHVEGFTMRQVDRTSLDTSQESEPGPVATLAGPDGIGIPPAVGVEMTLALLAARAAGHVVVRPFRDGQPVPLTDGPPAPAPAPTPAPALPRMESPRPAPVPVPEVATAPAPTSGGSTLERLRPMWADTLGIAEIAAGDDFFELGGNSMSAIELMSQVRDGFGVELNIGLLFDAPTLAQLTELLDRQLAG